MDQALIALAGIVVGAVLGGTGKYFTQRRDAWSQARTSGLLLLAEVRAVRQQGSTGSAADPQAAVTCWESQRAVLAGFRRGNYPNGLRANEWLTLADRFTKIRNLSQQDSVDVAARRRDADASLAEAEKLLARFEDDPPVFSYVLLSALRLRGPRHR